jgi:hypothetical protein
MKRNTIFGLAMGMISLLGSPSVVFAGSLTPANYENRIELDKTISVNKTVTIGAQDIADVIETSTTTVNNKYDILFLADNTGSMGTAIGNVQTNARALLQQLSTSYNDVQFGVARYYGDPKEYLVEVTTPGTSVNTVTRSWTRTSITGSGKNKRYNYTYTVTGMGINESYNQSYTRDYGSVINYYYQLDPAATTKAYQLQEGVNGGTVNDAIAAINNWEANGGGDLPEANMFALQQAATSGGATDGGLSTGYNTQWRADAKKIIVWFGDAASHEFTVNKAEAIRALNNKGITVVAINASNTTTSLISGINTDSQATSIATATNGEYAAVYSSNLANTMLDLIGDAVENITTQTATPGTIDLEFTSQGDTSGITVTYTCTDSRGCNQVPGNQSRTFRMDVKGNIVGKYNFDTIISGVPGATGTNKIEVYSFAD